MRSSILRSTLPVLSVALASGLLQAATLALPAVGGNPVVVANTSWDTVGKGKSKIKGFGKAKGDGWGFLEFGPNTSLGGPESGWFNLNIDDGMADFDVYGAYDMDDKGRPVFAVDIPGLETELEYLILSPTYVTVSVKKVSVKARPMSSRTRGESIAVRFKVVFTIQVDGDPKKYKASMSYKGKGGRWTGQERIRGSRKSSSGAAHALVELFQRLARETSPRQSS